MGQDTRLNRLVKGFPSGLGIFLTLLPAGLRFLRRRWMEKLPSWQAVKAASQEKTWSWLGLV